MEGGRAVDAARLFRWRDVSSWRCRRVVFLSGVRPGRGGCPLPHKPVDISAVSAILHDGTVTYGTVAGDGSWRKRNGIMPGGMTRR